MWCGVVSMCYRPVTRHQRTRPPTRQVLCISPPCPSVSSHHATNNEHDAALYTYTYIHTHTNHTDPRTNTHGRRHNTNTTPTNGGWRALATEARRWCSSSASMRGGGAVVLLGSGGGAAEEGERRGMYVGRRMCMYVCVMYDGLWYDSYPTNAHAHEQQPSPAASNATS